MIAYTNGNTHLESELCTRKCALATCSAGRFPHTGIACYQSTVTIHSPHAQVYSSANLVFAVNYFIGSGWPHAIVLMRRRPSSKRHRSKTEHDTNAALMEAMWGAGSFVRALRFWATHSPAAGEAARAHGGDGFKLSDKVPMLSTLHT